MAKNVYFMLLWMSGFCGACAFWNLLRITAQWDVSISGQTFPLQFSWGLFVGFAVTALVLGAGALRSKE